VDPMTVVPKIATVAIADFNDDISFPPLNSIFMPC
jgi:hypothetical protein